MSSHREAPETSKDPVADNTDVYAFVDPNDDDFVVLIANFLPFQKPDGGPNFYEFGEDVLYEIKIANTRKGTSDIRFQWRFTTKVRNPNTFLYNTGPISSIDDPNWNRPQYYTLTRMAGNRETVIARDVPCPPNNVGPRSTPNYEDLAAQGIRKKNDYTFFAGQRAEGFYVDLGSIFDLGTLRPFQEAHLLPSVSSMGVDSTKTLNVHSIALRCPIAALTRNRTRVTDPDRPDAVIGVWATASRRKSRVFSRSQGKYVGTGPWEQVSRLGNPLFNEVITPMAEKDEWNAAYPYKDASYAKYVNSPELAKLLPVLYPDTFPKLKAYDKPRADLNAILLTGLPAGVVPGFQNNTGPVQSDMLRLNVAIPPTKNNPKKLGLIAGDAAGFPNGRRVIDDVTTIELRAVGGVTIPLVDPSYEPDAAVGTIPAQPGPEGGITDGSSNENPPYLSEFPFLAHPNGGYQTKPGRVTEGYDGPQ